MHYKKTLNEFEKFGVIVDFF